MMPGPSLNPAVDGYALTADGNIIHTRATLTYRIADPITFVFNFVNASNAVQNALDNALHYAATRSLVDDVLTRDVIGFNETGAAAHHRAGCQTEPRHCRRAMHGAEHSPAAIARRVCECFEGGNRPQQGVERGPEP